MYITHYTSSKFEKVETLEAAVILGTFDLDEMTDEEREALRNNEVQTMCNVITTDNRMISIPWEFVIEISHGIN